MTTEIIYDTKNANILYKWNADMKGTAKSDKVLNTTNMTNTCHNMNDTHGFFLEMTNWIENG